MEELKQFYSLNQASFRYCSNGGIRFHVDDQGKLFVKGKRVPFPYAVDKIASRWLDMYVLSQGKLYEMNYYEGNKLLLICDNIEEMYDLGNFLLVIDFAGKLSIIRDEKRKLLLPDHEVTSVLYPYVSTESGELFKINVGEYEDETYWEYVFAESTAGIFVSKVVCSQDHYVLFLSDYVLYRKNIGEAPYKVIEARIKQFYGNSFIDYRNNVYHMQSDGLITMYRVPFEIKDILYLEYRGDIILSVDGMLYIQNSDELELVNIPFKVTRILLAESSYGRHKIVVGSGTGELYYLSKKDKLRNVKEEELDYQTFNY